MARPPCGSTDTEHMRRIGKAGFQAFARKLGYMGGSRLGAIQWLQRNHKFPGQTPAQHAAHDALFDELWKQLEPKDPDEEDPVVARYWRRSGRHRRPNGEGFDHDPRMASPPRRPRVPPSRDAEEDQRPRRPAGSG